jgi:hypothetical protein
VHILRGFGMHREHQDNASPDLVKACRLIQIDVW